MTTRHDCPTRVTSGSAVLLSPLLRPIRNQSKPDMYFNVYTVCLLLARSFLMVARCLPGYTAGAKRSKHYATDHTKSRRTSAP